LEHLLEPDARATTEGGRITEDGQTAMLVNKQRLSQEERSPQGEKAKNGSLPQGNKRVASGASLRDTPIYRWYNHRREKANNSANKL
jgi:hypothetical protein